VILKIQQQTPEWLAERCGRVTASRVADVMNRLKNGQPGAKRKNYLIELVSERLTGFSADHYVSDAMVWGCEQEPYARAAYEVDSGNEVDKAGIAIHPTIEGLAASPDGTIGTDGLFEAKCPNTTTHIEWMLAGEVPDEHKDQCYTEMACWERDWVDFVSFDPRVPPNVQLFKKRLPRDDKRIAEIEYSVIEFLAEVDEMTQRLAGINPTKVQLRRSVDLDAEMMITDADKPAWMQEMGV
jgi:predicted phage-related endonuclease